MTGLVYKSTGSWYQVRTADGKLFQARLRGLMKLDNITSTNPIAVGDTVTLESEEEDGDIAVISEIVERKNYVARISPHNKHHHHIVASNLDQSLLFATLRDPKTSQGFIDRFLVACEMHHVPAVIVFNKADLYKEKENRKFTELNEAYAAAGYRVILASVAEKKGMDEVMSLLKNKTTLLSGHSGVGKSSFINLLFPELKLRTQDVSDWSGKGLHTTTFAEMFDLPGGGRIIDTPGIRELALAHIDYRELSHFFPEMRERLNDCQFNDCLHLEEPGCAIKKAVAKGELSALRYDSYCTLLASMQEIR